MVPHPGSLFLIWNAVLAWESHDGCPASQDLRLLDIFSNGLLGKPTYLGHQQQPHFDTILSNPEVPMYLGLSNLKRTKLVSTHEHLRAIWVLVFH